MTDNMTKRQENTDKVTEHNKLIAEFMGGIYKAQFDIPIGYIWLPYWNLKKIEYLRYHSSWDWLMPVVEKIALLEDGTGINISYNTGCTDSFAQFTSKRWIKNHTEVVKYPDIKDSDDGSEGLIKIVYIGVVRFIKWYNQNK